MAGGILKERIGDLEPAVEVQTAGLVAQTTLGLSENAVAAMREVGVDITGDQPQQLDARLIEWADLVIPMERRQGQEIASAFPRFSGKIRELASDIEDPYGSDLPIYRDCRDRISEALDELIADLPV